MKFDIRNGVLKKATLNKEDTDIIIPDSVTCIGDEAFCGCERLKNITIPDSVTSIENYAFCGCERLKNITIPDSVTSIENYAFCGCTSLESITIPDSVTSIGDDAFRDCTSLASIIIPNSVTSIGEDAFAYCTSLESITIPDSVTSIGKDAFWDCTSLKDITIPDSVTSIGKNAFWGCTSLESITIPDSVTSISEDAFWGCESLKNITIPDSVTCIGKGAFENCTSLKSITIPDSVTDIGNDAFSGCTSLKSITIPDSVTSIGGNAFRGCNELADEKGQIIVRGTLFDFINRNADKELVISSDVTSIGEYAFSGCDNLENVIIPNSVTSIGKGAFNQCTSLKSITIPDSVTSIGEDTFWGCTSLKSITIPDSVTSIGEDAFVYCESLESISIPNSVTSINKSTFENCTSLKSITIPDNVTSIGEYAFAHCESLESISIPNSVTSIGDNAFHDCTSLKSITIPDSVTCIGGEAFCGCESLESISIPNSVTRIEPEAFAYCESLESISIPNSVTRIQQKAFEKCNKLSKVNITAKTIINCKDATLWNAALSSISSKELMTCIHKCPKKLKEKADKILIAYEDEEVIRYYEKQNRLDNYAKYHNTTADELRDTILSDFGLDKAGNIKYSLGENNITVHLERNLSISIVDDNGKILKSVPKKGSDPNKYENAKKEIAALKKEIPSAVKIRNQRLLSDWLEKRPRDAKSWKSTYLENPILTAIAKLLVWEQDKTTFILDENGCPIDEDGNKYGIGDADIYLAHPMDMKKKSLKKWQEYFVTNHLSQPFEQVWEPVLKGKDIKPNRYEGTTIPLYMLMNKEMHGIVMEGNSTLKLRDCSADMHLTKKRKEWIKNEFEITNFKFKKYTRAVNHIAVHFDKGTVEGRLLKDDVSAIQWLDYFTLAQITKFIKLVTEKGKCPNVTSALLAYKDKKYSEAALDAFADFVLDL